MTDRQIECIVAIAEQQSLTNAAKLLYVSQSSLSQLLSKVETELNAQLFIRTSSAMLPTYAGRQVLESVQEISSIKRNLYMRLNDASRPNEGQIRIGIAPRRSYLFMPVVLSSFMKEFPGAEIELIEEDQKLLEEMVLQGKVDLAFIVHPSVCQHLKYQYLYREPISLALPKNSALSEPFSAQTTADLSLAANMPFILVRRGHDIRRLCEQAFSDAHIVPNVLLESHSMDVCLQMAANGLGATIVPDTLVAMHPQQSKVICYPLGDKYSREIAIAYREDVYLSHIHREFIRVAAQQIVETFGAPGRRRAPEKQEPTDQSC